MNKLVKRILIVIILLIVVGLIFYPKVKPLLTKEKKPAASGKPQAEGFNSKLPVSAVIIEPAKMSDKLKVVGNILANESLEIRTEIAGKVTGIYFDEGEKVKKGQLLLKLDASEMQAELEKLRYQKKLLEKSESRERRLLEKNAVSQEEYDQTLTELNKAKADIKVEEARMRKIVIRAPFSGTVGLRYVSPGSYVMSTDVMATLYNIDPAKVEFSIPGKYSDQVTIGDKITFKTENREEEFQGEVYAVEPKIDPQTRTLLLRAKSPNKENKLLPGMFVRIELTLSEQDSAIMVPTEAVIPELGGHKVFVSRNGKAHVEEVLIGQRTARNVQILEGLTTGDTLITSGILQLRPNTPVELKIQN